MKDKDQILLESIYELIVEDAQSTKNSVLNKLVSKEVGNDIFKYKNKPENVKVINAAREKFLPIIDEISNIIINNNPKDKNLSDLEKLVSFYFETNGNTKIINDEYKDYVKYPSLLQKKTLQNSKSFQAWNTHTEKSKKDAQDEQPTDKTKVVDPNHDPNQVYEDDEVIVFLADTGNPKTSIENCRKYGKGTSLCISSSKARHHYNKYRLTGNFNKDDVPLTTYFVLLKKENRYILIGIHEDGEYEYNNVSDNIDELATPKEIIKKYPQLSNAFEENIFKFKPIEGRELEYYKKYYNKKLSDFTKLDDKLEFISNFNEGLTKKDWDSIKEDEIEPILNVAILDTDNYIPLDVLSEYPNQKSKYFKLIAKDYQDEVNEIKNKIKNGKIQGDLDLTNFDTLLIPEIFPFLNDIISISGGIGAALAKSLNFPQLQTSGNINASSATSLNLPQLKQNSGYIDAGSAKSLNLPQLKQTSGNINAGSATSLNLPQLQTSRYINAGSATSLNLPQLQTSGIINAESATSLNLPQLQTSGYIFANSATSLNLPQLQTSGTINASSATSLNLPQLQTSGSIYASSATSVVIPKVLHSAVRTNGKLLEPRESDIHIKQESFKNYFRRNICLQH
jgi:hypothetical protein